MKSNSINNLVPTQKKKETINLKPNKKKTAATINHLNQLLANYHIYHQNLQTFLWNITEVEDFGLRKKIEGLHTQAALEIKEIADRILALKHQPINMLANYLNLAEIKESKGKLQNNEMVMNVLESHKTLIQYFQKTSSAAAKSGDINTVDMITRFMKNIEKSVDNI